jgi:hypothetical protein
MDDAANDSGTVSGGWELKITAADTVTYYFDSWSDRDSWDDTSPDEIVDNDLGTYSQDNNDGHYVHLDSNTCPGTDLGTISTVEVRVYWAGNSQQNAYPRLIPYFGGTSAGDNHDDNTRSGSSEGFPYWSGYFDITSDTNAPGWSWSDVQNLDLRVVTVRGSTGRIRPRKIEVRVTYSAGIAFDATSNANATNTNSLTWQHTVGTDGSDRILVVGVSWRNSGAGTQTVSGVTYNSQALTLIRKDEKFDSESRSTAMYYLKNPPTGSAYDVVVSFSGGNFYKCVGGAISLTGVDQTNPVDAHNGVAGGSNSPASVTVTTNTDGAWVVDTVIVRNPSAPTTVGSGQTVRNPSAPTTVGSGQTERWNVDMSDVDAGGSHEGPKTPAGDVTMSWTIGTNDPYSISAAAFKPASGGISFVRSGGVGGTSGVTVDDARLRPGPRAFRYPIPRRARTA